DEHVVADAIAQAAEDHGDLDRLAVLVAAVVAQRVAEGAGAEHPVSRLDVVEPDTGPQAGPRTQRPVADALERRVRREVAPDQQRVEPVIDRDALQLIDDLELVLPVDVDREDVVVRALISLAQTLADRANREAVRRPN